MKANEVIDIVTEKHLAKLKVFTANESRTILVTKNELLKIAQAFIQKATELEDIPDEN
jgi:hypothetical protein